MLCGYKGLDDGGALPSRTTPNLTCPSSSQETKKDSQVNTSCFPNWQSGRRRSHRPSPPLSPRGTPSPLSPLLHPPPPPSQFPPLSGWLVFSVYSPTKETKEAGLLSLSPSSLTPHREEGCRPAGPPFLKMQRASAAKSADKQNSQMCRSGAGKKNTLSSILWHHCRCENAEECAGAEEQQTAVYFVHAVRYNCSFSHVSTCQSAELCLIPAGDHIQPPSLTLLLFLLLLHLPPGWTSLV